MTMMTIMVLWYHFQYDFESHREAETLVQDTLTSLTDSAFGASMASFSSFLGTTFYFTTLFFDSQIFFHAMGYQFASSLNIPDSGHASNFVSVYDSDS